MSNEQAQMPTGGSDKNDQNRRKKQRKTSKMKTTTIIKDIRRATTGMRGI